MSKPILFFGIGPLAATVYQLALDVNSIEVKGFIVDDAYFKELTFLDLPVYKLSEVDLSIEIVMCIGYKNMRSKKAKFEDLKNRGFKFANIIHPTVIICQNVTMGVNNILFPDVLLEPNVKIGDNNLIWSKSSVGHDAIIGNHNFMSGRVSVGGLCEIKDNCFLGVQVAMIQGLVIEDETNIIAGSFLYKNTSKASRYFGSPAKKVSEHFDTGIEI
jgi:UDP-N-acetylbacillosamine N-acetyltransferase